MQNVDLKTIWVTHWEEKLRVWFENASSTATY